MPRNIENLKNLKKNCSTCFYYVGLNNIFNLGIKNEKYLTIVKVNVDIII